MLYLYDNCISVIENVATLRRLTHLYLANNQITCISGLAGMRNLAKLYLEHNCIQVRYWGLGTTAMSLRPCQMHRTMLPAHSSNKCKPRRSSSLRRDRGVRVCVIPTVRFP